MGPDRSGSVVDLVLRYLRDSCLNLVLHLLLDLLKLVFELSQILQSGHRILKQNQHTSDHMRPHETTSDHTRPRQTTRDHIRPLTHPDHTKPHQTIRDHIRPYKTTPDHTRPNQTTDTSRPMIEAARCCLWLDRWQTDCSDQFYSISRHFQSS